MSFPVDEESERDKVNRILYFFSRDYQFTDQIEMKDGLAIVAVTSDRIFLGPLSTGCITCYLDKSQIGSHNLTLIPVETVR